MSRQESECCKETADVQFLVPTADRPGRYRPENRYRHSIHWNSVKRIINGTWEGSSFFPEL